MELIDRDALIAKIENDKFEARYINDPYVQGIFKGLVIAECFAFDAPVIDAKPVVHAEWKYFRKQNRAVCTNCSFERDLDINFGKAVACPNCGAKMG